MKGKIMKGKPGNVERHCFAYGCQFAPCLLKLTKRWGV